MFVTNKFFVSAVLAALSFSSTHAFACASCGCTLSSDWELQGISATSGLKIDLRYDYLNQDQLRSGTGTISPVAASRIVNGGNPQEVEQYTANRYYTLALDYNFGGDWGINVQLPYILRDHSTLGTASDGIIGGPGGGQYFSRTSNIGDVKLVGRYLGFSPQHNFGVLFGVKLPSGRHDLTGTSTDPTAPAAVPIDRGLQPGSGTTDLIVGAYYADVLNKDWDYFAQGLYQSATDFHDGYKPGNGFNLNGGLRYMGFSGFMPQLQLNARNVGRDRGPNADRISTGGTLVYLSPGVVVPVSKQASIYSFVQVPLYQDVRGGQLAPRYTLSVGARYSF